MHRDKKALPLEQPGLVDPVSGSDVKPPFQLESDDFSKDYEIMSSQFQITAVQGNYSEMKVNKIRDFEDLYGDTGPPDYNPIDLNKNIDLSIVFSNRCGVGRWKVLLVAYALQR